MAGSAMRQRARRYGLTAADPPHSPNASYPTPVGLTERASRNDPSQTSWRRICRPIVRMRAKWPVTVGGCGRVAVTAP